MSIQQLPQPVLSQLLRLYCEAKERLSGSEQGLAARICSCTLCHFYWVRRKSQVPLRCPSCHKRGWDRPMLTALLAANLPPQVQTGA